MTVRSPFDWQGRLAEPPDVITNHLEVPREGRKLVVPVAIITGVTVDQYEWVASASHFILEFPAGDLHEARQDLQVGRRPFPTPRHKKNTEGDSNREPRCDR